MLWHLFAIFLAVVWVVSLCLVVCASCMPSTSTFSSNHSGFQKRNVLLVVAHPDDESMFFAPTILHLMSRGHNLYIVCLSTGNIDGKGNIRKEELYKACSSMKVPLQQVKVVDHPALQDGFNNSWNHDLIAKIVKDEINDKNVDLLITFDNCGVSGHRNHRDVHLGICTILCEKAEKSIEAWELISTSLMRKYIGPVDVWWSLLSSSHHSKVQQYCVLNGHPHKSFIAMAQHKSQWICYPPTTHIKITCWIYALQPHISKSLAGYMPIAIALLQHEGMISDIHGQVVGGVRFPFDGSDVRKRTSLY